MWGWGWLHDDDDGRYEKYKVAKKMKDISW